MNVTIHLIVFMLWTYPINAIIYYQMHILLLIIFICCLVVNLSWPAYYVLNLWLVHNDFHNQNQISPRFVFGTKRAMRGG